MERAIYVILNSFQCYIIILKNFSTLIATFNGLGSNLPKMETYTYSGVLLQRKELKQRFGL